MYANLNKEIPFPEKSVSTESTPCEPLYVTMNPATPKIPSEEKKRENEMAVEGECVRPLVLQFSCTFNT